MKILPIKFLLAGLFIFALNGMSITGDDDIRDISAAIRAGDAKVLADHFNTLLDLELPGNEGSYSKAQAEIILRDFFGKYPPSSFSVDHTGASNDGSQFAIGTYKSGGKTFKTYLLLKKKDDRQVIIQLQFDPEK
jgi:hypothetical protein